MEKEGFSHPRPPGIRTGFAERRKYPRYDCELPIDCITSGMLVRLHDRIELGSPLRINVIFTRGFQLKIVRANAVIIWCQVVRHAFWGKYRYGLRLIELEERFFSDFMGLLGQLARQFHLKNLFPSS
jgi:hypothetical protein